MILNPFALDARSFLLLYLLLLAASLVLSLWATRRLRPEGHDQSVSDPDSLALLAGGPVRLAEAAVARLMANQALAPAEGQRFVKTGRGGGAVTSPIDRAMLALPGPARWQDLTRAALSQTDSLSRSLERQGLLMDSDTAVQMRLAQLLPFAALLMLGTARLVRGVLLGRPVGFLAALLVVTLALAVARWAVDRRTRAGIRAVKLAKVDWRRLRLAPTNPEMALAVAVFGTAVLAGSALEPLHRLRSPGDGGSGGESGSGCSGGGGCGGGGCGG